MACLDVEIPLSVDVKTSEKIDFREPICVEEAIDVEEAEKEKDLFIIRIAPFSFYSAYSFVAFYSGLSSSNTIAAS
ncbi:hypothetical protein NDU88_011249 [Pleurodeles waltl]|uniref:Uncharacterized protein n=1 Tax=Pleurodeles waltl TaxID=8319 RepID=A0AAV7Q2K3_PLEWA|nr:hypothetical protein NDU88_011249 [Pleurodeles waltl]